MDSLEQIVFYSTYIPHVLGIFTIPAAYFGKISRKTFNRAIIATQAPFALYVGYKIIEHYS